MSQHLTSGMVEHDESDSEARLPHREGMLGQQFREAEARTLLSQGVHFLDKKGRHKYISERLELLGKLLFGGEEREEIPEEFRKEWLEPILRSIRGAKGFSLIDDDCYYQVNAVLSYLRSKISAIFKRFPSGRQAGIEFSQAFPVKKVLELIGIDLVSENRERLSKITQPFKHSSHAVTDVARKVFKRSKESKTGTPVNNEDSTRLLGSLSHSRRQMSDRKLAIYGFNSSSL
ncbi:hypothetical protein JCM3765_000907 [Sporobolomyces pararoseus]